MLQITLLQRWLKHGICRICNTTYCFEIEQLTGRRFISFAFLALSNSVSHFSSFCFKDAASCSHQIRSTCVKPISRKSGWMCKTTWYNPCLQNYSKFYTELSVRTTQSTYRYIHRMKFVHSVLSTFQMTHVYTIQFYTEIILTYLF